MKIIKFLISPAFMGVLFVLFAISMAVATFIENDFGSAAAYGLVYDTLWFELILFLLSFNLSGQIITFRLYRREKLTVFLFHSAFLVILAGAAITRFFGYEGLIRIREGEEENRIYSAAKYIGYNIKDENGNTVAEELVKYNINSNKSGKYSRKASVSNSDFEINLAQIIPNAKESVIESPSGVPVISLMVSTDGMGMKTLILRKGESAVAGRYTLGFESADSADIRIFTDGGTFYITSDNDINELGMMRGDSIFWKGGSRVRFNNMKIYDFEGLRLVPAQMTLTGISKPAAVDPKMESTGRNAFIFHVFAGDKPAIITLWDNVENEYSTAYTTMNGKTINMFYGSMVTELPFTIRLNDFILERYPGSNSPSGYKSDVLVIDTGRGIEKPYLIFMNNTLKYHGYRFFQSSFDRDEKGTVLSVNHDIAGMLVTYTGYGIMMLFILLSIFSRKSVFHNINPSYWSSPFRKISAAVLFILILSGTARLYGQKAIPGRAASDEFGKVLVQDQKGRTKPLYTLSNDILRKVTHENEFEGLSSMQVFLGIWLDFNNWQNVKLIRVSNSELQGVTGIRGNMASFSDIVDMQNGGNYKLSSYVQEAYQKAPGERTKFDKEVMKVDERLNIVYMIYTGQFLKLFPLKKESNDWGTSDEAIRSSISREDSLYLRNVLPMLSEALRNGNIANARQISESVSGYQLKFSGYKLPSKTRIGAEVLYYRSRIFERLFPFYALVGITMLIGLIATVIRGRKETSFLIKILGWHLFAGFIFHTAGLALRWYISGHSPMSNGYESMIFISWVTLLAGFIFSRRSAFALSATAVLGSMTLMVAHLSFMDPEITNLVPVLKSYLLTLHVSVITGSYGFLGLGSILGLINMILLVLSSSKNLERIGNTVEELTVIIYQSLTLGLYFITIGTFLGAVWANESWGRYWGWDPKETWSLITIVIYSIVIHSRSIPGLKDIYTFNLLSLFSFSSVLMTYFGVNYYLSGLHSYAGGDPVPVPAFVYIAVILLGAVSFFAYLRYSNWKKLAGGPE